MHIELSVEKNESHDAGNESNTEQLSGSQVACAFKQIDGQQNSYSREDSIRTISITMGAVSTVVALYISLVLLF